MPITEAWQAAHNSAHSQQLTVRNVKRTVQELTQARLRNVLILLWHTVRLTCYLRLSLVTSLTPIIAWKIPTAT